jgi:hypothetical protein
MVGSNLLAQDLLDQLSPKDQVKYRRLEEEVAEKQDQLMEQQRLPLHRLCAHHVIFLL